MAVTPLPGSGAGNFAGAVRAAKAGGITAIASQGKAQTSQHLVHDGEKIGVDDGATGHHDYGEEHVQVLDRLHAHGAKLTEHDARIERLEGKQRADLGSPDH